MAERIRLKVWMLGLGPIVLVLLGIAVVATWGGSPGSAQRTPVAAAESLERPPSAPPPPMPIAAPSGSPLQPAATVAPTAAATASAAVVANVEPEPIPELDEMRTPPGSQGWSRQQKLDYMQKVLDHLTAREDELEREVAAAQRARDPATEQRKAATLAYLKTQKASFERMHDVALGVRDDHDHD